MRQRPLWWNGIDVGARSVVCVLGGGELWVHSPVELDSPTSAFIEALGGEVAHIVVPNFEHVKYARQWAEAYPTARVWGCPGLAAREPHVPFSDVLPDDAGEAVGVWQAGHPHEGHVDCVESVFFGCEVRSVVERRPAPCV